MMDPLRSIIMSRDNPDEPNDIIVEEGIDCREADSRFFSLLNTRNHLNIIVSNSASLLSCKLDGHEIIVHPRLYNQSHETWAIGDRPYQRFSAQLWNCHVRGTELLLSTANGSSSIMFELTRHNELNSIIKLKSIFLQNQVTYFNLNNAKDRIPIDGHSIVVQCNGNLNRIQIQATKLLCRCNRRSPVLPKSFVGDIPYELVRYNYNDDTIPREELGTEDDFIVCDSIFYLEATSPLDFLKVQLQYQNRILLFEVRMSPLPGGSTSAQTIDQSAGVSSSTAVSVSNKSSAKAQFSDLRNNHAPADFIKQSAVLMNLTSEDSKQEDDQDEASAEPNSSSLESPSTSSTEDTARIPDTNNNNPSNLNSSSSTKATVPSTILRARVRITNFGVCIMPLMMANYSCTYRFSW